MWFPCCVINTLLHLPEKYILIEQNVVTASRSVAQHQQDVSFVRFKENACKISKAQTIDFLIFFVDHQQISLG